QLDGLCSGRLRDLAKHHLFDSEQHRAEAGSLRAEATQWIGADADPLSWRRLGGRTERAQRASASPVLGFELGSDKRRVPVGGNLAGACRRGRLPMCASMGSLPREGVQL